MELDGLPSMVMHLPAVTLTFDLLTQKPNLYVSRPGYLCEVIQLWSYKDIALTRFFWSLPAVTLTFELLTTISNQHIYEPKYICDQNWVKFRPFVVEIRCSQCFRD